VTSTALANGRTGPGAHPGPPHLALVRDTAPIDLDAAADAIRRLLAALGQDVESPDLADTPRRVAAAYAELLTPEPFTLTTFPNDGGYDELVLVRDVPFRSLCEHHLLPFHGVAHVGYRPAERIVGLSKLARVVEHYAHGLQVQERLTQQVADCLRQNLRPKGVMVVLEAEHLCMSLRGVRASGARTVTSALHGLSRQELYCLLHGGDLGNGLIGIDLTHCRLNVCHEQLRVTRTAQHQPNGGCRLFGERQVEFGLGVCVKAVTLNVAYYADDCPRF